MPQRQKLLIGGTAKSRLSIATVVADGNPSTLHRACDIFFYYPETDEGGGEPKRQISSAAHRRIGCRPTGGGLEKFRRNSLQPFSPELPLSRRRVTTRYLSGRITQTGSRIGADMANQAHWRMKTAAPNLSVRGRGDWTDNMRIQRQALNGKLLVNDSKVVREQRVIAILGAFSSWRGGFAFALPIGGPCVYRG